VNIDEVPGEALSKGTKFGCLDRRLALAAGGKQLGCSHYEVEPGRSAFPKHFHCANEEAIFVLDGEGTLRIGDERVPIRGGDYISFPVGPEHAHRVDNTGARTLKYLCFSTMTPVEVVGYPDSQKVGVRAAQNSEQAFAKPWIREIVMAGSKVGYYDGEDIG
jgi:uncharacterized cupin superfamily protein